MKKLLLSFIAAVYAAVTSAATEIPPYNPPPKPPMPQGVAIAPGEVKFTLPEGLRVAPGELNRSRSLNGDWRCSGLENSDRPFPPDNGRDTACLKPDFDDSGWDSIRVIEIPASDIKARSVILHFGVIGYEATLWVNGQEADSHHGDFVPWSVDITGFVKPGRNLLALKVLSDFGPALGNIRLATHTYGSQWSVSNIKGGIWQDVELRSETPVRIEQLLVTPQFSDDSVRLDYRIVNSTGRKLSRRIGAAVTGALRKYANEFNAASPLRPVELAPGLNTGSVTVKLKNPVRWDLDNPHLYYATLYLAGSGGIEAAKPARFGFREFRVRDGKFHLNGRRIYLFGENLRSVNFGGNGSDAGNLAHLYSKLSGFKSLGCNIIRNAHMPAVPKLYEIADEIGLMIYDEWGWCFTGRLDEPEFAARNSAELEQWLIRDYNHPSVVMWSCGNEIVHRNNPPVLRQLARQVDQVRAFDRSGRPAVFPVRRAGAATEPIRSTPISSTSTATSATRQARGQPGRGISTCFTKAVSSITTPAAGSFRCPTSSGSASVFHGAGSPTGVSGRTTSKFTPDTPKCPPNGDAPTASAMPEPSGWPGRSNPVRSTMPRGFTAAGCSS